ncbi:hypothetical protein SARC_11499 [Sphaeroforma arctica JP610]|uniref:Uncharacterized protein n=1 Tax=Sphaeroforma arctica JP610 TaxID=667725 RepID=A0A0L0FGT4_9EUKA|nr:hypothetical protein SARC_11499 [Sphaeroforma arctica JP610]KNC75989.1 hypothetical protein SARC_11499 [Sphaeroforma arctica JP610]|eukprot:XP_014149891.1 hypothetical protein SARC_11499 [Sphaeroforma arctica JP610]
MPPQKSKHLSGGRDKRHSLRGPDSQFRPVTQDEELYVPDKETEATSDSDEDVIKNQLYFFFKANLLKTVHTKLVIILFCTEPTTRVGRVGTGELSAQWGVGTGEWGLTHRV